uniref:Helix-turn-helix domain-containing protein n=1 Tax=uncultured Bacillota bacterium TaxID=344338 RepID=A0A650EP17_9FIRM|nr:hypothetical protein Firmicute1046_1470 [uncultured Firmicutes bacterium]
MKIFAIRSDADKLKTLGYLIYYEKEKLFYIELPENADPWETPLLLSSFAEKNIQTVNSYWSRVWVQQRIVPADRQNLGQVLRDNDLKEYDEFELLMLSNGRCAQDDYYLEIVDENDLPSSVRTRFTKKIEDVVPLADFHLLVFFRNGLVKKCDIREFFHQNKQLKVFLELYKEMFYHVRIQNGGYGVYWEENMSIADFELYKIGEKVPLSLSDFRNFVTHRVINTAEAAEILNCSRQNIDDLVRRDRLHPIKTSDKNKMFLKSEVLKRNWE